MSKWIDIGPLEAIPQRGARVVKTAHGCVALFRTHDDLVFALRDRCAHKGGPLSDGLVHGHKVTCPLHNWVYDMTTGEAQGEDKGKVPTYPVKVEDGRILLDAERLMKKEAA